MLPLARYSEAVRRDRGEDARACRSRCPFCTSGRRRARSLQRSTAGCRRSHRRATKSTSSRFRSAIRRATCGRGRAHRGRRICGWRINEHRTSARPPSQGRRGTSQDRRALAPASARARIGRGVHRIPRTLTHPPRRRAVTASPLRPPSPGAWASGGTRRVAGEFARAPGALLATDAPRRGSTSIDAAWPR